MPHARLSLSTVIAALTSPSKIASRSISAQHRWMICVHHPNARGAQKVKSYVGDLQPREQPLDGFSFRITQSSTTTVAAQLAVIENRSVNGGVPLESTEVAQRPQGTKTIVTALASTTTIHGTIRLKRTATLESPNPFYAGQSSERPQYHLFLFRPGLQQHIVWCL